MPSDNKTTNTTWTLDAPGILKLEGTEFSITAEKGGDFALRYRGLPYAGTHSLAFGKMRTIDHIAECGEIGIEFGKPDTTIDLQWK